MCDLPKISIIVPVFNVAPFLNQCVDSLLTQSFSNVEVILINDGSTDGSGNICDEYAQKDPRICVIHQQNTGLSGARNEGLVHTTGDYVLYLDSDDWIEQDTCEIALKAALEYNADVVLWASVKEYVDRSVKVTVFPKKNIFEGKSMKLFYRRIVGLVGSELKDPTKTDALSCVWGKLYRKDLIINSRAHFYDTKEVGSEDALFNIQVFGVVKKAVYLPYHFNHYRQNNPGSLTRNYKPTYFKCYLNFFQIIQSFLEEKGLMNENKIALNNRIALSVINNFLNITSSGNAVSLVGKISLIKTVLNHRLYRTALKNLPLNEFPIHWKVFFLCCKIQFALGAYLLTIIMKKFR